jgi:hypothetical protein
VTLSLPGLSVPLIVSLFLSKDFPSEPPSLSLSPPVAHPWIEPGNGSTVIGLRSIQSGKWNLHLSLGRVVQELADELIARPPRLLSPSMASTVSPLPEVPLSRIPIDPSLQSKTCVFLRLVTHLDGSHSTSTDSIEELELLLRDSQAFQDFFEELDQVKNSRAMERDLIQSNFELAEQALAQEESFKKAQDTLNSLIQDQSRLMSDLDGIAYKQQNSKMVCCLLPLLHERKSHTGTRSAFQRRMSGNGFRLQFTKQK